MKYTGILVRSKMEPLANKAYGVYLNQRNRCYRVNDVSYKYYGAKGIKVEYGSRDFIGWFIENIKNKPRNVRYHVGRIDHKKNYSFGNIELVTGKENRVEAKTRTHYTEKNTKRTKVKATNISGLVANFTSIYVASQFTRVTPGHIATIINNKCRIGKGWRFQSSTGV